MEAAVRWSPHGGGARKRFLLVDVADSSLTLNQIDSFPKTRRGKVEYHAVSHYSRLPPIAAFDWSKSDESIVALGFGNRSASLVKLRSNDEGGSETLATLKVKQPRKGNSIAFSTQDWLALAVDRTRSDVCLFIYDTRRAEASADPIRRLCAAELVSSVRFFPGQPQEIVTGTQRAFVRIYDLRDAASQSGTVVAQASTRNVNNIAIDPLDENYFAAAGSTADPCVTVWDRRWMLSPSSSSSASSTSTNGAVLEFNPVVSNAIETTVWSLRYSGQRRGRLALCSSTGELKTIDMTQGSEPLHTTDQHGRSGSGGRSSNCYVSETRVSEAPYHDARHGQASKTRIVAYDWVNEITDSYSQPMIALRANGAVHALQVPSAKPCAGITARQDMILAFDRLTITEPAAPSQITGDDAAPHHLAGDVNADARDEDEKANGVEHGAPRLCDRDSPRLARLLSPGTLQQDRCRQGYLFDCKKNADIVAGNFQLERLWEIVGRYETIAKEGMIYGSWDLSYLGISALWSEQFGTSPHRHLSHSSTKPAKAIVGLGALKKIPAFEGERTSFPEHRQLCLLMCGWKFTVDTLEAECQELIERGLYYQAIVQAVLHDHKHIALNLLRTLIRSKTIENIGLGALLATDEMNEAQKEMCLWMAADTSDPALKALLTFLNTGDWRDVMKTNYLHLGYRMALGLRYLNDTELSGFIQSETARGVKNGDLEGLLLTGLGEQAMDLFQTYITKTNDLQTAVLATAFTNPKYVHDDARWDMWKQTYLEQMLGWRCWAQKARFTVLHNRMARVKGGKAIPPSPSPPPQTELSCLHCQAALGTGSGRYINPPRTSDLGLTPASADRTATRISSGPAAHTGTVCLRCGRHLPRCGICLTWLGTPDPARAVSASSTSPTSSSPRNPGAATPNKLEDGGGGVDVLAQLLTFCVSCGHGFHADHARMWFAKWDVCPVADCRCVCGVK